MNSEKNSILKGNEINNLVTVQPRRHKGTKKKIITKTRKYESTKKKINMDFKPFLRSVMSVDSCQLSLAKDERGVYYERKGSGSD